MGGGIGSETESYAPVLLSEVEQHASSEGSEAFLEEAFTDLTLDLLEEQGFWPDYQLAHLSQHGLGLSAWGIDPVARVLYLSITDFVYTTSATRFTKAERKAATKRLKQFFRKASSGTLALPEHSPVLDAAEIIRSGSEFDSVRCAILTNRVSRDNEIEDIEGDIAVQVRVWDLETIRRSRTSGETLEPIEIDLVDRFGAGLACLPSPKVHPDVKTLLTFVPAEMLAAIYHDYGPRLLERNVRSFLMARGKINQGIRDTLRTEPERFLAYNNGLTATASSVKIRRSKDGVPQIVRIEDLQIVNGGQTTASIAVAAQDKAVDLSAVEVQMKLAVVSPDLLDALVPNISRFANRQNAVQDSDLSANLDYLRALERSSRTEWVPSEATGRPTKWYFERARGSYEVDKSQAGTASQQAQFTATYPVSQRFGKNEVALYENTWSMLPHVVCRGGQKSFAEFLLHLESADEGATDEERRAASSRNYRDLIAKAILFKSADAVVRQHLGGTYKRAVVAYSLAYLYEHLDTPLDLGVVWRTQRIAAELEVAIRDVSEPLKEFLIESASGRNITEWAKSEACWTLIRAQDFPFSTLPSTALADGIHPRADRSEPPSANGAGPRSRAGKTLAECIEEIHGEPLVGSWRRYRRKAWSHFGATDIPTLSGHLTLDLYSANFEDPDGLPYTLLVAVDFPAGTITPTTHLDPTTSARVEAWINGANA